MCGRIELLHVDAVHVVMCSMSNIFIARTSGGCRVTNLCRDEISHSHSYEKVARCRKCGCEKVKGGTVYFLDSVFLSSDSALCASSGFCIPSFSRIEPIIFSISFSSSGEKLPGLRSAACVRSLSSPMLHRSKEYARPPVIMIPKLVTLSVARPNACTAMSDLSPGSMCSEARLDE